MSQEFCVIGVKSSARKMDAWNVNPWDLAANMWKVFKQSFDNGIWCVDKYVRVNIALCFEIKVLALWCTAFLTPLINYF